MIIKGDSTTKRTELLINEYLKLINNKINSDEILVLVQNSKKKKEFIQKIKELSPLGSIGNIKIYSYFGLVYNTILDNWALIENSIKNENRKIIPNLCGLEVSQYIFKKCIKEINFTGYNSKTSLLHQLLRRNSLINLNNLTTEELDKRSEILAESYAMEAKKAIDKYKIETINYRAFDYIRQINLFEFLYKKTENPYKYIFLDDGDEITPAIKAYIEAIRPTVKEFFIGYDPKGSSRLGYLGAINVDFEKLLDEKAIELTSNNKNGDYILNSIQQNKKIDLKNIDTKTFLKRNEMVNELIADIKNLLNKGIKPFEIAVITPICDSYLKSTLDNSGLNFNFLTKNEKLNENKIIGYILELLKIINDTKNFEISPYVLKGIFIELLNLDKTESIKIIQQYKLERDFKGANIFEFIKNNPNPAFNKLIEIYQKILDENLSAQLIEIVENFVKFDKDNQKNIIKINQLIKQIYDFEEVFKNEVTKQELINQLENTIISENPLSDEEISDDSIVVSSAQKIIDYTYRTKYQFLLDVSSDLWLRQDIGPLYNAWVMQKTWSKDHFDLEDNIELTLDRTSRTLYKLLILAQNITLYSSVYDTLGQENFSGIDKYFLYKNDTEKKLAKPITPRDDQKQVLNYKGGLMSVSATAGSGKTTIMLLLVDKILQGEILQDILPCNIFVLTFMESAARNFKERIKARYPDLGELPSISTIHGLALRIIKENNNYSKLNLDHDFEIVDEIKKAAILTQTLNDLSIDPEKLSLYDSAISSYKNELAQIDNFQSENKLFIKVFNTYQQKLKDANLIDYDDLLLLSLKLLKQNQDVLNYYQNLAKVIIEDEAQDSSSTQQALITLLGGRHKNIIRCGDINQAITSTFTNSDVKGFKEFIKKSKNAVMDRCQRCATGVLDGANTLVKYASENKIQAFSDLIMKPVENINIVDKNAILTKNFDEEKQEVNFVISKINEICKKDKNSTIAILLRSNFAIAKWEKLLQDNSIKVFNNSSNLINNNVYSLCLLILEFIKDPFDIKIVQKFAQHAYELGLYSYSDYGYALKLTKPIFLDDGYDYQIWWDLTYFLYKNHYSIYDLLYELGCYYFSNSAQNVNIPLVSAIAQKIYLGQKTFENTVSKMREIQYKSNFSNIKFFSPEDNSKKASKVQIMTLHKSKGDEFDYVFIPELTEENLCFNTQNYKLKENSKFIQNTKKHPKTDDELKIEIIEENLRLIYVGITRAKKKLYLTSSDNYKYFSKVKNYKRSEIFDALEVANEKN